MLAFDTHAYVKSLQTVGFTEEQAEVQANALKTLVENDLATKYDLKELEVASKRDLKELETKMETRFKELETKMETQSKELETKMETQSKELELRLTTRLGGMLVVGIAVVATLVKLL